MNTRTFTSNENATSYLINKRSKLLNERRTTKTWLHNDCVREQKETSKKIDDKKKSKELKKKLSSLIT